MFVCTYDNPATMHRECWRDGVLLCSYSAELLLSKPLRGNQPIPGRLFFHGANVGDWKAGRLVGDALALVGNN